jgi:LysM repeat protein
MNSALNNLAAAIKAAASAPIELDTSFLNFGLADAKINIPKDLDTVLAKAFGTPDGSGLNIAVNADDVGPVADNTFSINNVTLTILGVQVAVATLTFGVAGNTLTLDIEARVSKWSWDKLSPAASTYPFNLLNIADVVFNFRVDTTTATAVQHLNATLTPPTGFKTVVEVIQGLDFPNTELNFKGTLDFSAVDGKSVLLPVTALAAPFINPAEGLKLGHLNVTTPSFGFEIPTAVIETGDDGEKYADQPPSIYFSVNISIQPEQGQAVAYQLRGYINPAFETSDFFFALAPLSNASPLFTPATMIQLVDNSGSFFSGTPPQLQQFLSAIGLRGMTVTGRVGKSAKIDTMGIAIGADPVLISKTRPFYLFKDPSNKNLTFAITDFELIWRLYFGNKTSSFFSISTEFVLLPEVFKGTTPDQNGLFEVEISSDYQIEASFSGTATMRDAFQEIADISLPRQIDASISNITASINVPNKSYSFSAGVDLEIKLGPSTVPDLFSISNGEIQLSASTAKTGTKTIYGGSFRGLIEVVDLYTEVSVEYASREDAGLWNLSASLVQPVNLQSVINTYFEPGGFVLPDFFQASLELNKLSIRAVITSGATQEISYTLSGELAWDLMLGVLEISSPDTSFTIAYDGTKAAGSQYSGKISTITQFSFLNSEVLVAFAFAADNKTLSITWEGLTATYSTQSETLVFTLTDWTVGSLVQKMMQSLGNPYFTLSAPWTSLNDTSLSGLSLTINLNPKPDQPKITLSYTPPQSIDLGFMSVNSFILERKSINGKDKITLKLDANIAKPLQAMIDSSDQKQAWNNLLGQNNVQTNNGSGNGQPIDALPDVPGRGNAYFDMPLLALGQRVGIAGSTGFKDTQAVITALTGPNTPSTKGDTSPISAQSSSSSPAGTPYYNADNNWLIAGHMKFLKAGNDWTVDLKMVFNDPDLYGLRLALAGEKAKALGNLVIDIIYKKVSDDVGLYQIEFTFPDSIRNLNFGQISVILPQLGIQIYTNGDFLIDVGFPYNMDFQRSFSISTIIFIPAPIPLTGAGGFYFGKLSSATTTMVPATTKGTFDPVLAFGFGLQLGFGYNIIKGPLKAGFALTVFGICEGIIAAWHPYQITTGNSNTVQDNYFFRVTGTVGVIGMLYGTVDFAIISASLSLRITLSLTLTYESHMPIPLTVRATVDVSVRVKIDLGLFSISFSLSFHADLSTSLTIGQKSQAPWDDAVMALTAMYSLTEERHAPVSATPKTVLRATDKPVLTLMATPQFTVMADEGETNPSKQQGAYVFMLAIDAPDATAQQQNKGTSFEILAQDLLTWLVNTFDETQSTEADLARTADTTVSAKALEAYIESLSDLANPPISFKDYLEFLSSFTLDIQIPSASTPNSIKEKFQAGSALFPMFDGLSLTATMTPPTPPGGRPSPHEQKVDLETYVTAGETYRSNVAELFEKLSAQVEADQGNKMIKGVSPDTPEISMAAFVFIDAFNLIGRQLLQAGVNAMKNFTYPLKNGNSIDAVRSFAENRGNTIDIADLIHANLTVPLAAGSVLSISDLQWVVQSGDTLDAICARYKSTTGASAETLIFANPLIRSIAQGVTVTVDSTSVRTGPGETFTSLAEELGITLEELAASSVIATQKGLLLPGTVLSVPTLDYKIEANDQLGNIAARFGITPQALFTSEASKNLSLTPLFDTAQAHTLALPRLTQLKVSDIWDVLMQTDQLAHIAGMLSRFLIYGLRLPAGSAVGGPTFGSQFLYPKTQSSYGLYQLIGQQLPVPAYVDKASYEITLERATKVEGIDLSFVTFNSQVATQAPPLDLSNTFERLSYLVSYAQAGKFNPSPTFKALDGTIRTAKSFSIQEASPWTGAGASEIAKLCALGNTDSPQIEPVIWSLPVALTRAMAKRQAGLARRYPNAFASVLDLLPMFAPTVTMNDPATGAPIATKLKDYAWSTRIDFTIRRLPPSANPTGTPRLASMTYEVVGPTPEDALLLERLLSTLDKLGAGVVADTYLLYSNGGKKLASAASSDFIAYFTQTNLSTETNLGGQMTAMLAGAEGESVTGIINPDSEVVKLIWELSTVRSGGYYLTYHDKLTDGGLPEAIFDDHGTATLTLVIAYASNLLQQRMTNFINSFITAQQTPQTGMAVSVVGQSSQTGNVTPEANDSLNTLSTIFGVGIGPIAEINAGTTLPATALLPISGIIHLVKAAQTLDTIAAYYSAGAVTPISGADITQINPKTPVVEGAVLFIPNFTCKPGPAPGTTLSTIAQYYGLTIDALAVSIREVKGLFGQAPITIDSLTYDLQATSGTNNLAFEITREAYPQPVNTPPPSTPTEQETYAQEYLFSLYTVISAGLRENFSFSANNVALPFGPQHHHDDGDNMMHTDEHQKRAKLRELAESDTLTYRHTLSIANNAQTNAAPTPPYKSATGTLVNPYIGVGSLAQLQLEWRDVFGNTMITPWRKTPSGYNGALNGQTLPVLYNDRLIGLYAWPNLKAYYKYSTIKTTPTLSIQLSLDTTAYAARSDSALLATGIPDWQQRAENDLKIYTQVWWQLNQDYSADLNLPWAEGSAVTVSLVNSLTGGEPTPLTAEQFTKLKAYVTDAINYLDVRAQGGNPRASTAQTITQSISFDSLPTDNIIPLSLGLELSRPPLLVTPMVAALVDGTSVTSPILPLPDAQTISKQSGYATFAADFEATFKKTGTWFMRVGAGLAKPDDTVNGRAQTLWAVRLQDPASKSPSSGIAYTIAPTPTYYAPKPLARSLTSTAVKVDTKFESDGSLSHPQTLNLNGIDANVLFETCLKAIDQFLSPTYATPAYLVLATQFTDPLSKGPLANILKNKELLASAIASTVTPVLEPNLGTSATLAAAREKLHQALLNELAPAYALSAVVAFNVDGLSGAPDDAKKLPARLYGQPRSINNDVETSDLPFTLSTARFDLTPDREGNSGCAFLFDSKNVLNHSFTSLKLDYPITYLEHDRSAVPGINGYTQSQWITFLTGPVKQDLTAGKSIDIPIVLRALPEPPTMHTQEATAAYSNPTKANELAVWDLGFSYIYPGAAQDAAQVSVGFNRGADGDQAPPAANAHLIQALTQFTTLYPQIEKVFENTLAQMTSAQAIDAGGATTKQAIAALAAFSTIVEKLAMKFNAWVNPMTSFAMTGQPTPKVIGDFEIELAEVNGIAHTRILNITLNDTTASYDQATDSISATVGGEVLTLPMPVIEIDPDNYTTEQIPPVSEGDFPSYCYKKTGSKPANYLLYSDALSIPTRLVKFKGLNLFVYQDAWAALRIERNKYLVPAEKSGDMLATNPEFIFSSPLVRFADPVIPKLSYPSYDISDLHPAKNTTANYLDTFFAKMASDGQGASIEVAMESRYSYVQSQSTALPRTQLPVAYLPPTPAIATTSGAPQAVTDLANTVDAWRKTNKVTVSGNSEIVFSLDVYNGTNDGESQTTSQQPILRIGALTLNAAKVPVDT